MKFLTLLHIECLKTRHSKIIPLIFIAPLLVVITGIANISRYFSPEYENAWRAMFVQSALLYAYYLLPLTMIVVCAMLAAQETRSNGIQKMLSLPVNSARLSYGKFCLLVAYLLLEILVFLLLFVAAGLVATQTAEITETLPFTELLSWCSGLFLTMLPCMACMWLMTVLFIQRPLLSSALNLLFVIPGILAANTSFWMVYPYCYSGYLFSLTVTDDSLKLFPFLICAGILFTLPVLASARLYRGRAAKQ